MFWLFLVLLIALPILAAAYGAVQWQTNMHQRELRSMYEPKLKLHFSGYMRWFPYLAMAVGGGTGLIAYATGPFGGISVLMMLDVGIGCYGWFVWRGPNFQAQHESHLHGAYEIGVIARSLASYNATAYAKYRLNAAWLKGIKPPLQRMAADNDIDYALRFIWRLVAERYAAANWAVDRTRLRDRQQLLDKAVVAGMEADLAVERILAIGRQYPGFGIKPGLLEWDIPGLKPPTPTT